MAPRGEFRSSRFRRALAVATATILASGVGVALSRAGARDHPGTLRELATPPAASGRLIAAPKAAAPPSARHAAPTRRARPLDAGTARRPVHPSRSLAASRFRTIYPAQVRASVDPSLPGADHWALLIGINDYAGGTRDNIGSYQDARDLRAYLLSLGWRPDHIVLLANRAATASMIVQGIRWLASKTGPSSTVVFNFSGHEMPVRRGNDGDDEARDVALWAADNRTVMDGELGRELGRVAAGKMWINLAVCRAGGFNDRGMSLPGRVITYSSPESELSYEDPKVHHSVFGWYEIMEGMVAQAADANHDGDVTVEEAFRYARPYAAMRTSGRQHPFINDRLGGEMSLAV